MNSDRRHRPDVDDELVEQAITLLPQIGKSLYAALARNPQLDGIALGQIKAMSYLLNHGPCAVRDVAEGLGVSMPTASETLDRLTERGMAERSVDPADRRRAVVHLAPEARRIMGEVREVRRRQVRAALACLEPWERPVFLRSLQILVEVLQEEPARWSCSTEDRTNEPAGLAVPTEEGYER